MHLGGGGGPILRKSGEVSVQRNMALVVSNGAGGWVVSNGRGKSCAGVIAALTRRMELAR